MIAAQPPTNGLTMQLIRARRRALIGAALGVALSSAGCGSSSSKSSSPTVSTRVTEISGVGDKAIAGLG
jgi:hypothetical protein